MHSHKKFTGRADCETVECMYRDFFDLTASTVTDFDLWGCQWGGAEGRAFAEVLLRFTRDSLQQFDAER